MPWTALSLDRSTPSLPRSGRLSDAITVFCRHGTESQLHAGQTQWLRRPGVYVQPGGVSFWYLEDSPDQAWAGVTWDLVGYSTIA